VNKPDWDDLTQDQGPSERDELERQVMFSIIEQDRPEQLAEFKPQDFRDWLSLELYNACRLVVGDGIELSVVSVAAKLAGTNAQARDRFLFNFSTSAYNLVGPNHLSHAIDSLKVLNWRDLVQRKILDAQTVLDTPEFSPAEVEQQIAELLINGISYTKANEAKTEAACAIEYSDQLLTEQLDEQAGRVKPLATLYPELDRLYRPVKAGNLIALAGESGDGKTAFALNLASNYSLSSVVHYVSLEMSSDELITRIVSLRTRVPQEQISPGLLREFGEQHGRQLHICDDDDMTPEKIVLEWTKFKARHPEFRVAFLDYLGLSVTDNTSQRHLKIAAAARLFKKTAKKLGIAIYLLCQFNSDAKNRQDKKPQLSDLGESKAIKQDSDRVIMLHTPHNYDSSRPAKLTELYVRKYRNGKNNTVFRFEFDRACSLFAEYPKAVVRGYQDRELREDLEPVETPVSLPEFGFRSEDIPF